MKKTVETITAWLRGMRMRAAERRKAAAECRMVMDARRTVQVREFKGEVWVCFGETPVLPVEGLKWDLPTTLEVARDACLSHWKEERGHGR